MEPFIMRPQSATNTTRNAAAARYRPVHLLSRPPKRHPCQVVSYSSRDQDETSTIDVGSEGAPNVEEAPEKLSSMYFPKLVQNLLWNASSMRERGQASCAVCRAKGVVVCPVCHGAAVSTRGTINARKQMREQSKAALQGQKSTLITNRCVECRGQGIVACPACQGSGARKGSVQ